MKYSRGQLQIMANRVLQALSTGNGRGTMVVMMLVTSTGLSQEEVLRRIKALAA